MFDSALIEYTEENYEYNFKQLLAQEAKLAQSGKASYHDDIKLLYEKTFPKKEAAHKQFTKMVKRVDKHLNEESCKVKLKE